MSIALKEGTMFQRLKFAFWGQPIDQVEKYGGGFAFWENDLWNFTPTKTNVTFFEAT